MRQLKAETGVSEDREAPLRIWRRGLYLSPPQLRYSARESDRFRSVSVRLASLKNRLLRRQ